jgi:hypothetical protein
MDDRLIHHPMFPKSSRSAHDSPAATVIAALVAALLVLALLLPSVGRVGVDAQDQPLRPLPGLGL